MGYCDFCVDNPNVGWNIHCEKCGKLACLECMDKHKFVVKTDTGMDQELMAYFANYLTSDNNDDNCDDSEDEPDFGEVIECCFCTSDLSRRQLMDKEILAECLKRLGTTREQVTRDLLKILKF